MIDPPETKPQHAGLGLVGGHICPVCDCPLDVDHIDDTGIVFYKCRKCNQISSEPEIKKSNPLKERWRKTSLKGYDPLSIDPNIFNRNIDYISKTIRYDNAVKRLVFGTILSAFTPTPLNTFLKGDSSIGKTYNVREPLELFSDDMQKDHVWLLGGLSPKALIHSDKTVLKDSNGYIIDLDEKPTTRKPKRTKNESKDEFIERKKDWETEKLNWVLRLRDSYYEVNLEGKLLVFLEPPQLETFNILRPILSHDTKETSYKMVEKSGGGQLRTTHVKIKGFPATIFCSSEEKLLKDLSTRSFNITPETTKEKLSDSIALIADKSENPWKYRKNEEWVKLESYLRWWTKAVREYKCLIPYAHELKEGFPLYAPRCMRDFKHILTLVEVHTLFHLAQRPILMVGNEKFVLATFTDFKAVSDILPSFEETTITGVPTHILDCFNNAMVPLSNETEDFTYKQLTDRYNEEFKQKRSSKTMYDWVRILGDIGYVTTYKSEDDKRKTLIKIIKNPKNTPFSSLGMFLNRFSEKKLENFVERAKKYSEKKVTLYENIIDKKEVSVNSVYKSYFSTEYIFSENKPEMASKSEKKPKNIPQQQIGTSPTIEEMLQPSTCFICHKLISSLSNISNIDGKPVHKACAEKVQDGRKNEVSN